MPPQPNPPHASVVVTTRDRAHLLRRLVAALEAQTVAAFEVVIVDDGSRDDTAALLHELAAAGRLPLRVIRRERSGGPAAGRNTALGHCHAEVVAFTDDDCVPSPGWLAAGLEAMGDADRIVVGRTAPAPDQPEGPFSRTLRVDDARWAQTANVFYSRDALDAVGGFDEALATGEDVDLHLRVAARGAEVVFAAEALVHHDVSPSRWRAALRTATRWHDIPGVLRRHPSLRSSYLYAGVFWKPSHPLALAAAAGLLLAPRRPWAVLLTVPWIRHRLTVARPAGGPRRRVAALPGTLVVDLVEVATMVRGSVRHRRLVL